MKVHITDYNREELSLVQFWVLQECHKLWPDKNVFELCEKLRLNMFDKVCGTNKVRLEFTQTSQVASILPIWNKEIVSSRGRAKRFFLYR